MALTQEEHYENQLTRTREAMEMALNRMEKDEMTYIEVMLDGVIREAIMMKVRIEIRRGRG